MRRGSLVWGLIILFAGVLFLLDNLGLLPVAAWKLIFPSALIVLGLWFLFGPVLFKGRFENEILSIPLSGANEAEIRFLHGAGELEIHALPDGEELVNGTFAGGVENKVEREGTRARLRLRAPEDLWMMGPFGASSNGLAWKVGLSRRPALYLDFKMGANRSMLDLADLNVAGLKLSTGASATEIIMPAQAGMTKAEIEAGAASIKVRLPEKVAGRIRVESGLAGISVDTNRFPLTNDGYESPNYGSAANRVDLSIKTGVGSVSVS